jgi:dTDP-4-amino-4,6-dideoxygalactose transaminase
LNTQLNQIRGEILEAVEGAIDDGQYILGGQVASFEQSFADYSGGRHGIGVGNGTEALHLALRALGIGPGDEVITAANTFVATALAIVYTGAAPVLVDVDPADYLIDVELIERAITPRTKAIVPVHLYGQPADMPTICEIAERHGLAVVQDACQAHGAMIGGHRLGSFGDAACYSFYPSKNLGAYGDGGIVTTDDPVIYEKVSQLRDIGQSARYTHVRVGTVGRLDDLHAAMLSVKLRHLDDWIAARRATAERYTRAFAGTPVSTIPDAEHEFAVYHLYVVELPDRDRVCAALDAAHIDWGIHYPTPIHQQQAYAGAPIAPRPLPVAEARSARILSLPMSANLEPAELDRVVEVVLGAFGGAA